MKEFYKNVCSSERQNTSVLRECFLIILNSLPYLRKTSLQSGKAPGPDGFGPEFYKKIAKCVVGPLANMFMESFDGGSLPPTLNLAHGSLILK